MLKKIKSLFIIEEGAEKPAEDSGGGTPTGTKKETPLADPSFVVQAKGGGVGQVQDKFLEVLFAALEANNQDGFDYMEFKDFLRSLSAVPMDDATRYKSAFATAQTMGATKEKILGSAKSYLEVLAKEQSKFREALEGQKKRNLTGKQEEITQLEQTIRTKESDIEKLKADIESHRQQITTLEQEINAASEKLGQTASDFEASYQALLGQIQADVTQIESHL